MRKSLGLSMLNIQRNNYTICIIFDKKELFNIDKLLSIIVPVYNTETYLPDILVTYLKYSNNSHEIIFVNDGSKDKSEQIILEYQRKYPNKSIKYFYQRNKGASIARNKGYDHCKGEYILFFD